MLQSIYCDGSVIKNGQPGQIASIAVLEETGAILCHQNIGSKTINFAEYAAVIWALEYAKKEKIKANIYTDSALIIGHVFQKWNCADHLSPLRDKVIKLLRETGCKLKWTSRDDPKNTASIFFKMKQKQNKSWKRKLKH